MTIVLFWMVACSGGKNDSQAIGPTAVVAVAVSPTTATLSPGATQSFAAQVTGAADTSVSWSLAEGAAAGNISPTGVYTAPALSGTYHIVATAIADATRSAAATVTVVPTTRRVEISIDPASAAVSQSGQVQFTAVVTGSSDAAVIWSSDGGAIDANGLFVAPTRAGTVHVTATSHADPTVSARASVSVKARHVLAVDITGKGAVTSRPAGISCPGSCSAAFDDDTVVRLTAGASVGAVFSGWAGACAGQGTCDVAMSADQSARAAFAAAISVTISPPSISLGPGVSHRFLASVSGYEDRAVTWTVMEGAAGGVIDSTGVYTAPQTTGMFHVVATSHADPARFATAAVTIAKPSGSPISACGALHGPGTFAITADLSTPGVCLDIRDTNDVTVDCGGHAVTGFPALSMSNVDGFSFTNCNFGSAGLSGVRHGVFQHDSFGPGVQVQVVSASNVRFDESAFSDASLSASYSTSMVVSGNTFVNHAQAWTIGAMIFFSFGSNNQATANVIDGNWTGSGETATDDGIVISDESADTISRNVISNVFDCGIETEGVVAGAMISSNTVTRAGECAIGGWWWNSLKGSTISGNTGDAVGRLFWFFRYCGLRAAGFDALRQMPADTAVYFSDNVVEGNQLVNGLGSSTAIHLYSNLDYAAGTTCPNSPGERAASPGDFVLTRNTFRGNQFGPAPDFGSPMIPGLVVDGGGNVCTGGGSGYPLVCN